MNWSKTQIVAFENDFRKRHFIESFFINFTPNVIKEKKVQTFSQISTKQHLAVIDLI